MSKQNTDIYRCFCLNSVKLIQSWVLTLEEGGVKIVILIRGGIMIISEQSAEQVWEGVANILKAKVSQGENMDWEGQFNRFWGVIEDLEGSLHPLSQAEILCYRKKAGEMVVSNKKDIDWSAYANTENNMSVLLGKIVSMLAFFRSHEGKIVNRGEKDYHNLEALFTNVIQRNNDQKMFYYEKELVACERYLALTRMAYHRNKNNQAQNEI